MSLEDYIKTNYAMLIPQLLQRGLSLNEINEEKMFEAILDYNDLYLTALSCGVEDI